MVKLLNPLVVATGIGLAVAGPLTTLTKDLSAVLEPVGLGKKDVSDMSLYVKLCDLPKYKGRCNIGEVSEGQCYNMNGWGNNHISSLSLYHGSMCTLYGDANCDNSNLYAVIEYPGNADMSSMSIDNEASSIMCEICPDGNCDARGNPLPELGFKSARSIPLIGIHFCAKPDFNGITGDCFNGDSEDGVCNDVPQDWIGRITSLAPYEGCTCSVYPSYGCTETVGTVIVRQGISDLSVVGLDNRIKSWKCDCSSSDDSLPPVPDFASLQPADDVSGYSSLEYAKPIAHDNDFEAHEDAMIGVYFCGGWPKYWHCFYMKQPPTTCMIFAAHYDNWVQAARTDPGFSCVLYDNKQCLLGNQRVVTDKITYFAPHGFARKASSYHCYGSHTAVPQARSIAGSEEVSMATAATNDIAVDSTSQAEDFPKVLLCLEPRYTGICSNEPSQIGTCMDFRTEANDVLASIKAPNSCWGHIFTDYACEGPNMFFAEGGRPNLPRLGWDHVVSSYRLDGCHKPGH